MPTEHAVDAFAAEPIVVECPLTGEQPESVRRDDRAPRARLGANRAVALPRSSRQIEIRLEADGATVTAAKVGLQHGAPDACSTEIGCAQAVATILSAFDA